MDGVGRAFTRALLLGSANVVATWSIKAKWAILFRHERGRLHRISHGMAEIQTHWRSGLCLALATALTPLANGQDVPPPSVSAKAVRHVAASAEIGFATVYEEKLEGQLTASGEPYRSADLTAAHRTYPLGTKLRVIGVRSGKAVTVRVNDRWGGGAGRVINLSGQAARDLGFASARTMEVRIEVVELGSGRSAPREAIVSSAGSASMTSAAFPLATPVAAKTMSRSAECADQAKILGLEGDWAERHTRACLANRPKK